MEIMQERSRGHYKGRYGNFSVRWYQENGDEILLDDESRDIEDKSFVVLPCDSIQAIIGMLLEAWRTAMEAEVEQ